MTRLFTPVQRLMGRLRYTSKFLLMSAVFGLPLLYLASGVLLHQYAALQDAQRLQDSVAQLRGMTHLTQGVERLRNLSMLRLGLPDLTHMPIYAEQLVQVDRQLEQFRLQQPERSLLIDRLRDDIARGSNRLYSEGTRPETVFDNAHMPVEQILGWRYELINRSGLLNRPPAGLEQAASILFNTLPSLQRRAGAVQAFGSYFLMHGHLDSSSTYMLNQAWQQLDDEIRQMQAMAQEQSGYARRLLDTVIGEARAIQDLFDAQLIQVFELNTPWEAYDAAAQAHLTRIQGAVDATLGELDARLREDYQARLWYLIGHGCGIVLISLLAVYLFVGFYLNVRSTVTGLRDAAERVAQGDYTTPVTTQTQDELARLAHALDDMRLELQRREDMLRDFSLRD
ncbi:MAG: HAMP domain-containing protein, partial [Gammaproteobacteria bacterium]|nr:HAMP domain-containing protein [Gammaproteobacteria bacterium]